MSRQRVEFSPLDSSASEPLIPGLPDEVATLYLLRVPGDAHDSCRIVSKSWNSIFKSSRRFSMLRKEFGFQDSWLFITVLDQLTQMVHVKAFNLTTLSWCTIHVTPALYGGRRGTVSSVSIPHEGVLYVFGGVQCSKSTVNVFLKYKICEDRWTIVKAMIGELGYITAGVIDGKVYVTGLDREVSDGEHDPVEVFDPKEGTWKPLPNYKRIPTRPHLTVFNGKLLLTYDDDSMDRIYNTRTDKWEDMSGELSECMCAPCAVEIHGHLFVLAKEERPLGAFGPESHIKLKVYDAESNRWDIVEGDDVPQGVKLWSLVTSWDSKIYVVKNALGRMGFFVGNVSRIMDTTSCSSKSTKSKFRVDWEISVDAPEAFGIAYPVSAQVLIG